MIKLNVHKAKTHLSHYLNELEEGETILLCKMNYPVAEIRPLAPHLQKERPIGLAKKKFSVPASFFEDLPEDMIALFRGEGA